MPFVRITTFGPALNAEQAHQLQQGATDLMAGVMRKPLGGIAVLVEQVREGSWSIAGKAVDEAANVEAMIGLNTNTPEEKALFMKEMMQLLRSVLGAGLREETYILLQEFEHDSYGRGGITRTERERRKTER
jgi:phenylpyruvate tautomerase PptA (4-oxalocrotonate tautomerase family)